MSELDANHERCRMLAMECARLIRDDKKGPKLRRPDPKIADAPQWFVAGSVLPDGQGLADLSAGVLQSLCVEFMAEVKKEFGERPLCFLPRPVSKDAFKTEQHLDGWAIAAATNLFSRRVPLDKRADQPKMHMYGALKRDTALMFRLYSFVGASLV